MTNEEKLKELTFQHAKMCGEELQKQLQTPLTVDQTDKMDEAIKKGIQMSVEFHHFRHLVEQINKNDVKELPFVNEKQIYRNVYYLSLLAECTKNQQLID